MGNRLESNSTQSKCQQKLKGGLCRKLLPESALIFPSPVHLLRERYLQGSFKEVAFGGNVFDSFQTTGAAISKTVVGIGVKRPQL